MEKHARIYIAGHRGLVGSAIVRKLQANGYNNLIVRTSAELDLRNQAAVAAFFGTEKPEYVFLAAAKVGGIHANDTYPAEFIRDNLLIQTNVIDSAYQQEVKKLLFLGSSCIYPKHAPQPLKEEYLLTGELEPTNAWYAIAKIAGIKMCQAYRKQYGFPAISLMPTNLYGSNDNFDLENSHVLPALIRKFHLAKLASHGDITAIIADEEKHGRIPDDILHNLSLTRTASPAGLQLQTTHRSAQVVLWGSGSPYREFMHVDDLADVAYFLMLNYNGDAFVNAGCGEDITIKLLAELVQHIVGFSGDVIWDSSKPDGTPRKLMDVSRINKLGWKAGTSLHNGIHAVYQHYCS